MVRMTSTFDPIVTSVTSILKVVSDRNTMVLIRYGSQQATVKMIAVDVNDKLGRNCMAHTY